MREQRLGVLLTLQILPGHHERDDRQQEHGDPDGSGEENAGEDTADPGAEGEDQDNAEEMQCFAQRGCFLVSQVLRQAFGSASQVPDAHCAGIAVAVHLSEGLDLHRAGKGNDHIGGDIQVCRHKSDNAKQQELHEQNDLPPVKLPAGFVSVFDSFRKKNPRGKCKQGKHVAERISPVSQHQILAHQNHIAGLRVGKYIAPDVEGVRVLQAAGKGEKGAQPETVRCLHVENPLTLDRFVPSHPAAGR